MSEAAVDRAHCPLCGEPNGCGAVAGEALCWCFDAQLAPEALARIPASARGAVCICAECGRAENPRGSPGSA